MWVNGIRFGTVKWVDNPNGKFKISWFPDIAGKDKFNWVMNQDGVLRPYSNTQFFMGVDPVNFDDRASGEFSKPAFLIKLKYNFYNPEMSNKYCLEYCFREALSDLFYEDVAMAAIFYGAKINVERSASGMGLIKYMKQNNLRGFLMNRPEQTKTSVYTKKDHDIGTPATPESIEAGIRLIETYLSSPDINYNENEVDNLADFWFEETIKQLMDYTVKSKTDFDLVAAMIQTELASQATTKVIQQATENEMDKRKKIFQYAFPKYDNTGIISQPVAWQN
jgi:hypothetical protein